MDFLQKPLAWFSKIYLRVQSKNCGRNSFFCFSFQILFRILSKIFSDFWPKNFKTLWKITSAYPQEQLVALIFFQKFWTVLDSLQKPLAWFSKFYLRVQSKVCGRNILCYSSFLNFFGFWAKVFFQTFGQKTSRNDQSYLLRVQMNIFWLEETIKSFETFWIFCRNLWHGSQNSIYVSRVKFAEEIFFVILPFWIFSNFEQKFFKLSAKKLQEIIKTTFCVCRWTFFGLQKLLKLLNLFGFSAETFGEVLKILSTCPE